MSDNAHCKIYYMLKKDDITKWIKLLETNKKMVYDLLIYFADNNYNFSSEQLKEIALGIENGLSKEQILHYAEPKIDAYRMKNIRVDLEETTQCNKLLKILADISNNVDGD